jgi:hypothetical protein
MQFKFAVLLYCAFAMTPIAASAQQLSAKPHPADPKATTPAVQYESAFAGYMPYRDEKLATWREFNDEAARVGGHIGIFGGGAHAGHMSPGSAAKPPASGSLPGMPHK